MWSQVTLPLSHLINILHSMKSSVGSSSSSTSRKHNEHASDSEHRTEVTSAVLLLVCISVLQENFVRNLKKHLCVCVCSPCWTCVSLAYQTWESSSWMSWWTVCYHIWVRNRQRSHWVDRRPGGPRISPHTPFSTISMVGMLPCTLYSLNRCSCSCYGIVDFLFPVNEST